MSLFCARKKDFLEQKKWYVNMTSLLPLIMGWKVMEKFINNDLDQEAIWIF